MAANTDISLRNKVIYQIFTRNYKDGKLKSVEKDLGRIKELGVDYIYLMPVQPSGNVHRKGSMGSPYAIRDYRAVDPVIGDMSDFIDLTHAAHEKGLKVLLDVVYNHTSPDSVLAKTHPDWFFHKADGSLGNRIGDWWDVVDLDYSSSKDLWDYQIDTLKMWAKYIDGFRCDVAPMVPLDFWKRARKEVEEVRPGCLWIAESIEPEMIISNRRLGFPTSTDNELYQAFDICYDYDTYACQKATQTSCAGTAAGSFANLAGGLTLGSGGPGGSMVMAGIPGNESSGLLLQRYLERVNLQEGIFPENYVKLRCLENHDRPRAAALCPDERSLRNWTAWQYFEKGTVMLYAGQEFEAAHHPTLFDLDTIDFNTGKDLSKLLKKLAWIRKNVLFADSSFHAEEIGGDVIFAVREKKGSGLVGGDADTGSLSVGAKRVAGFFTISGKPRTIMVDLPDGTYTNLIDNSKLDIFEHTLALSGEPVILTC